MIVVVLLTVLLLLSYFGYWTGRGMGSFYTSCPMIISHRGVTEKFPENTIEAYKDSVKMGFKGIELDVLASKDGIIYCSHNHQLERETKHQGYIHQINSEKIDEMKTGKYSHPDNQVSMPRLSDVLVGLPYNIRLNIEIKFSSPFDFSTVSILRKEIIKNKIRQPILISSFNPLIVFYARWFIPNVKTGYLVESMSMIKWMHLAHPDCLHPRADLLNENLLKNCKTKNISINTWTVNSIAGINYCKNIGVDGIITDRYNFEYS